MENQKFKGGVKIMLSYDYCHFEICLSSDEDKTLKEINEMRKQAQRLADEAVRQYIVAKAKAYDELRYGDPEEFYKEIVKISKIPEPERTPEQKAALKVWEDYQYNYEDDQLAGIAF